jgi:NAD+ kinase
MTSAFKAVALIGRYQSEGVGHTIAEIAAFLRERGVAVLVDSDTAQAIRRSDLEPVGIDSIGTRADLAIAIGGDGTMLGLARHLARSHVPMLGINHGRLGFVTDIALQQWRGALDAILAGEYEAEDRTMLSVRVMRGSEEVWSETVMNDVVVNRSSRAGMIELQVHVDGVYMYSQRADGLIVATPTGSTAYSLSANGPILHPRLAGIVLVPIAPQALSNRPIALPDDVRVDIRVVEGRQPSVAGDMQVFNDLQIGDDIRIERSPHRARFLHPRGYSYFATLRSKLNWHELPTLLMRHPIAP